MTMRLALTLCRLPYVIGQPRKPTRADGDGRRDTRCGKAHPTSHRHHNPNPPHLSGDTALPTHPRRSVLPSLSSLVASLPDPGAGLRPSTEPQKHQASPRAREQHARPSPHAMGRARRCPTLRHPAAHSAAADAAYQALVASLPADLRPSTVG
ncbi:hypothetical protein JB92DRAFT_2139444 [Gautieria morchelliformis]|nr:hypothetical protein JB92DRAFT_2139444 [Gautieria morchelliformis]